MPIFHTLYTAASGCLLYFVSHHSISTTFVIKRFSSQDPPETQPVHPMPASASLPAGW